MRFPSLIRLPKNKQYQIKPRYYDPIKEEIAERTEKAKRELEGGDSAIPTRITFERKASPMPSAGVLQLIIAIVLIGFVIGWLYLGNDVFYYLIAVAPLYIIYRFINIFRKH